MKRGICEIGYYCGYDLDDQPDCPVYKKKDDGSYCYYWDNHICNNEEYIDENIEREEK